MNNNERGIEVPSFMNELRKNNKDRIIQEKAKAISSRKRKLKMREMREKKINTFTLSSSLFILGLIASLGHGMHMGKKNITNEVYGYVKEYNPRDDSINGWTFGTVGGEISFDSAMTDIINDARYGGMSDVEISIGLGDYFNNKDIANAYLGEFSFEEVGEAKLAAYYGEKAEEYGFGFKTGGLSK